MLPHGNRQGENTSDNAATATVNTRSQDAMAENTDEVPAFLAELKLLRPGERMSTLAQQA